MTQATLSPPIPTSPPPSGGVVFAAGEKFFVRRVTLAPGSDPAAQVALALEVFSPFPAAQLYFGYRTDAARTEVLIFAAYRKNFSPEEIASWAGASVVLPDFAVWLGTGSVTAAGVTLREIDGQWEAIAWDGRSELPAAVIVRNEDAVKREVLIAEACGKAGLRSDAPVKVLQSAVEVSREKRELILRLNPGGIETRFDETSLGEADIRDKEVLNERRQTLRRDTLLWRAFVTILGGLAACVVLELGLLATRAWLATKQTELLAQAPVVKRIDQAQSMAKRLEEISTQRLLPFEMLNALNEKRPNSVLFTSVSTKGLWQLDIRAEANNADDATNFEADIRRLPGIESVEVPEKRTREGVTAFTLEITFKPDWYQNGGGA